jgi:hypothetical protein
MFFTKTNQRLSEILSRTRTVEKISLWNRLIFSQCSWTLL